MCYVIAIVHRGHLWIGVAGVASIAIEQSGLIKRLIQDVGVIVHVGTWQ